MSSRSTSPKPPEKSGGGTLSNDALYAPLATYADRLPPPMASRPSSPSPSSSPSDHRASAATPDDGTGGGRRRHRPQRHSLSLQTSSSLRESSLLAFLAQTSHSLRAARPRELRAVYGGVGGSTSAHGGAVDADHRGASSDSTRGMLEGKLSNRNLLLVGGGIHRAVVVAASSSRNGNGKPSPPPAALAGPAGTTLMHVVASSTSAKRQRKRVGGNGTFGSISNKRRKRVLNRISTEKQRQESDRERESRELAIHDVERKSDDVSSGQEAGQQQQQPRNEKGDSECRNSHVDVATAALDEVREKVGTVIVTLHEMWGNYIRQLVSTMGYPIDGTTSLGPAYLDAARREAISLLLAASEHVGMPATIVECPSRRHLIDRRCVVVDETKETWKVATIAGKNKTNKNADDGTSKEPSKSWTIVMVPKRGTALEVDLPWYGASVSNNENATVSKQKMNHITVRLEC